jgi:hypothetical protein
MAAFHILIITNISVDTYCISGALRDVFYKYYILVGIIRYSIYSKLCGGNFVRSFDPAGIHSFRLSG